MDQGHFDIFPKIALDFSVPYTPMITQNLLMYGVKGDFYPSGTDEDDRGKFVQDYPLPLYNPNNPAKF